MHIVIGDMNPSGAALLLGKRILVAEDQALICMDLCSLLEGAGAEVVGPAWSVEKAQELAAQPAISCGVLDILLRDGPVFPAAEILKQNGIGIVFLTAQQSDVMLARDWSGAQVVAKPAAPDAILKAVAIASSRPCTARIVVKG